MNSPVNIYTEWGPLKEVIIGDFYNYTIPTSIDDVDVSFRSFYNDNLFAEVRSLVRYRLNVYADDLKKYPEEIELERKEDLDNWVKVLESFGVLVKRPGQLDQIQEFKTPYWTNVTSPCGNIRDQFLIVGNDIIETSPLVRGRYFENDLVKDHFLGYFKRGARWTVAPRPRMLEESFDRSYFNQNPPDVDPTKFEIMFDGAQCLKFGRDIIFNVGNENHRLGMIWLQRHLGERFRVHEVAVTDNHIDGMFLPLRPGVLLMKGAMYEKRHLLPKPLQTWDVIRFADEDHYVGDDYDLLLASKGINVNVLSLDERHVVINELASQTIRTLEKHKFVPVPLRLRHSRIYSGAFHCSSLDIYRDETLEDYF